MDVLEMTDAIMAGAANAAKWREEFMRRSVAPLLQRRARMMLAGWTPEQLEMLKQESPAAYAAIFKDMPKKGK